EDPRKLVTQFVPATALLLCVPQVWVHIEALANLREELRLDRTDRDVLSIGGLIHPVVRRTAIEEVALPLFRECATQARAAEVGHERDDTIGDRRVHHLPAATYMTFMQRSENSHHQIKAAAAEIADQIERRGR